MPFFHLLADAPPMMVAILAVLIELAAGRTGLLPLRMTLMTPFFRSGRWFERRLNRHQRSEKARFVRGLMVMMIMVLLAVIGGNLANYWAIQSTHHRWIEGFFLVLTLTSGRRWRVSNRVNAALIFKEKQKTNPDLAKKSLSRLLRRSRRGLAYFSRRDMTKLDDYTLGRMAVEIMGRAADRGFLGPVFWYLLAGLPGLWLMAMTMGVARSVGILAPHIKDFGLIAARSEKIMLMIPVWLVLVAWLILGGVLFPRRWLVIWRILWQAPKEECLIDSHDRWLLGPLAGSLDIALLGPRAEAGQPIQMGWLGHGTARVTPSVIHQANWVVLTLIIFLLFLQASLFLLSLS
jgi:adenosylcobinamide-phosphate synthase